MSYEFKILYDLYIEDPASPGNFFLTKKNCLKKWLITDLTQITDCREVTNEKGKVLKARCEVFNKPENRWVTVKENYKRTKEILNSPEDRMIIKGFRK